MNDFLEEKLLSNSKFQKLLRLVSVREFVQFNNSRWGSQMLIRLPLKCMYFGTIWNFFVFWIFKLFSLHTFSLCYFQVFWSFIFNQSSMSSLTRMRRSPSTDAFGLFFGLLRRNLALALMWEFFFVFLPFQVQKLNFKKFLFEKTHFFQIFEKISLFLHRILSVLKFASDPTEEYADSTKKEV